MANVQKEAVFDSLHHMTRLLLTSKIVNLEQDKHVWIHILLLSQTAKIVLEKSTSLYFF